MHLFGNKKKKQEIKKKTKTYYTFKTWFSEIQKKKNLIKINKN
jgi:hypothetical protein